MDNQVIKVNGENIPLHSVSVPLADGTTETQLEANFFAEILSVSEQSRSNTNGTMYRIATVEFANAEGEQCRHSAIMWEKNFEQLGETKGLKFLTTVRFSSSQETPSLYVSHLTNAGRATASTFGVSPSIVNAEAKEVSSVEELDLD